MSEFALSNLKGEAAYAKFVPSNPDGLSLVYAHAEIQKQYSSTLYSNKNPMSLLLWDTHFTHQPIVQVLDFNIREGYRNYYDGNVPWILLSVIPKYILSPDRGRSFIYLNIMKYQEDGTLDPKVFLSFKDDKPSATYKRNALSSLGFYSHDELIPYIDMKGTIMGMVDNIANDKFDRPPLIPAD